MSISKRMLAAKIPDELHPYRRWRSPEEWRLLHGERTPPVAEPGELARESMAPGWVEISGRGGSRFTRAEPVTACGVAAAMRAMYPESPATTEEDANDEAAVAVGTPARDEERPPPPAPAGGRREARAARAVQALLF